MKKIIENLQGQIESVKHFDDDLDAASWNYEEGVLISANEAIKIVELFNEQKAIYEKVMEHMPEDKTFVDIYSAIDIIAGKDYIQENEL